MEGGRRGEREQKGVVHSARFTLGGDLGRSGDDGGDSIALFLLRSARGPGLGPRPMLVSIERGVGVAVVVRWGRELSRDI